MGGFEFKLIAVVAYFLIMPPLQFKQGYRCNIRCGTCAHFKADGQQCRNRVCLGRPYCYAHSKSRLGIKAASVKHLFATRDFPPGHFICPYVGERIDDACLQARYPGDVQPPYYTPFPPGANARGMAGVDSACFRGLASYVRPKFKPDGTPETLRNHNAVIERRLDVVNGRRRNVLWLKSTKRIRAGEEIFCYPGPNFRDLHDYTTYRTDKEPNDPCPRARGRVIF